MAVLLYSLASCKISEKNENNDFQKMKDLVLKK